MTYDRDELRARRDASRARSTRLRIVAATVLVLAAAGVAIAVLAGTGGDRAGSQARSAAGGAAGSRPDSPSAESDRPAAGDSSKADWRRPLSTPEQEAKAIARLVRIGKPIFCGGGRNGRYVALTFDDGPGAYTHFAIRKLKKWKARATFFVMGNRVKQPEWRSWAQRETELAALANHSWSHPYLPGLDLASARREMADTKTMVEQSTGAKVQVFRPPYGARNEAIDGISSSLGMAQIIWDVDSLDSQGANYAAIARNVIAGMRPGAIILMHENRGQTIRALPTILPQLRKRRLTAVTVPELLALDPPSDAQLKAGPNGCGSLRGNGGPARPVS